MIGFLILFQGEASCGQLVLASGRFSSLVCPLLGAFFSVASAQEIPQPPTDPTAKAAYDAFKANCSRCHQVGLLDPAKAPNGPKKGFGYVLDLKKVVLDNKQPTKIVPGKPDASEIIKRIDSDDFDVHMPNDYLEARDITKEERAAIVKWIESLAGTAVASCGPDHFISNEDVVKIIADDLDTLSPAKRVGTRYLTLVNLYNLCLDEQRMEIFRQGTTKLLNSLSLSANVVRPRSIGPGKAILRYNISDLGWRDREWSSLLSAYPYRNRPDSTQTKAIEQITGTPLSYIRADWFAENASRAPLYDAILQLPGTFGELQKMLSVDVTRDIDENDVMRAGFQNSGVSNNNRMIERHKLTSRSGYFWTSYDFADPPSSTTIDETKSLFQHPLGPGGPSGFQPDGGETIFSLPNGFQAYYLNLADGSQPKFGRAGTNIVQDPSRKDKTVTNGISCMGCHVSGMKREFADEIRSQVEENFGQYGKETLEKVRAIHPTPDEMRQVVTADEARFLEAERSAGLDLKLVGAQDPINALAEHYQGAVNSVVAAAELGLTRSDFEQAIDGADAETRSLAKRLQKSAIHRDEFESVFAKLVKGLTEEEILPNTHASVALFCSIDTQCVAEGHFCGMKNPEKSVLIEINNGVWTELWTNQDNSTNVTSGPIVRVERAQTFNGRAVVNDVEIVLYEAPYKLDGRPEKETIGQVTGEYFWRMPSDDGTILTMGRCGRTDQSIPDGMHPAAPTARSAERRGRVSAE